jgi:16S rRNA (adenine1518-N6/adenine1519-N6)-dimethyltransferase
VPREEVFAVVDAAFAQRRKVLRAALARWAAAWMRLDGSCAALGWTRAPAARSSQWPSSLGIAQHADAVRPLERFRHFAVWQKATRRSKLATFRGDSRFHF